MRGFRAVMLGSREIETCSPVIGWQTEGTDCLSRVVFVDGCRAVGM